MRPPPAPTEKERIADAQGLAKAEATARRWFRTLQSVAGTDMSDEEFSVIHRRWMAAERAVVLQRAGALAPPASRRS
ncbi:MAG: hypothetical protein ABIS47_06875 [Acidimicrobiales bacterium]